MGSKLMQTVQQYLGLAMHSPYSWYILFGSVGVIWLWRSERNQLPIPVYGGFLTFSKSLSNIRLQLAIADRGMGWMHLKWYKEKPMILIPRLDNWTVLVHGKYIEEMSRAPEDQLSFSDASAKIFQRSANFGQTMAESHYHTEAIRKQLTRNLPIFFPEIYDEVQDAISHYVQQKGDEAASVTVFSVMQKVVARASNRALVGLPYCRDEEWVSIVSQIPEEVVKVATIVNFFPTFLRPIVGRLVSPGKPRLEKALRIIGPMVNERLAQYGTEHVPDDYTAWLISYAPTKERNVRDITSRILVTNFAAIHTTTTNVTHAIYWLLSRPHYIVPLREEIQQVTRRLGWTRDAVASMHKLDSFMKECIRLTPIMGQVMNRIALRPFTFSNGLRVPAGASLSAHLYATHLDESLYPNANQFDAFRFVEANDEEKKTDANNKPTMYTTSPVYLGFGHGKHACPGRFFASMEVKLILAYLIANYDMRWPDDIPNVEGAMEGGEKVGYRPKDVWFNASLLPDRKAKILLRKRGAELEGPWAPIPVT